jgi:hypothetical protein
VTAVRVLSRLHGPASVGGAVSLDQAIGRRRTDRPRWATPDRVPLLARTGSLGQSSHLAHSSASIPEDLGTR